MKYFKLFKIKLCLTLLALFIITNGVFAQKLINSDKNEVKDILAAANKGLSEYLEKIPKGKEELYGFKNREEFALATIGKPYVINTLNTDFHNDVVFTDKIYIVPTGEARVPIIVNGEYRALLTVGMMNGVWETVGLGAMGLAKELAEFEKEHPLSSQSVVMLRVQQSFSDFILIPDNSSAFVCYPLSSAKMILGEQKGNNASYSLSALLAILKISINHK